MEGPSARGAAGSKAQESANSVGGPLLNLRMALEVWGWGFGGGLGLGSLTFFFSPLSWFSRLGFRAPPLAVCNCEVWALAKLHHRGAALMARVGASCGLWQGPSST